MKEISFSLNPSSIRNAITELNAYKTWVKEKAMELVRRLAAEGYTVAQDEFAAGEAAYDEGKVAPEPTSITLVEEGNGYRITATGEDVCFIEFGAGITFNSGGYPDELPSGIVGIGEYGKGNGSKAAWGFYHPEGSKHVVVTRGTPAQMPMYKAKEEMRRQISEIAKEVFAK